ncbi:MAG TPA: hypothetical protein PLR30_05040 [Saprospiraceae bacterium]|nr:hypothetical protein [Saprospiraceae bacterium]
MEPMQGGQDNYSFIDGGLFRKVQMKLGVHNHQGILALAGIVFAWLPLVVFTTIHGTLYDGAATPFLQDVAMHARILIALPVLILIRNVIGIKTTAAIKYMSDSLLDSEERHQMVSVTLPKMRRLACSSLTELILILLIVASVFSLTRSGAYGELLGGASTWKFTSESGQSMMTLAGKWAFYISIPFFQFLLLQWIWRYIVWIMLLFRFSRLPLLLLPTHADRAGGLGILILAQRSFSFIFVAGSLVISGQLIVHIMNAPDDILMVQRVGIGYIILCVILLLLPLVFFIDKLVKIKQIGLLHMSKLGTDMSRVFESEWLNDQSLEKRIEDKHVDPSMAYDYASMYDNIQQLRVVPVTLRDIASLVLTIALPFIPILFVYYSAAEVLQKIIGLLM